MKSEVLHHVRRHDVDSSAALVLGSLFLVTLAAHASDHLPSGGCGSIYYGNYNPREPRSLEAIPQPIRSHLLAHIQSRVGSTLFEDISFEGGQIVDLAALRRTEPDSKDYQWIVPTYNLCFQLRLPGKDIYRASIELDGKGTVLKEIALPNARSDPAKAHLLSREQAMGIAIAHAVPAATASIEMTYFRDTDTLEWLFCFHTEEHMSTFRGRCLHVPAHEPQRVHWSEFVGDY